MRPELLSFTLGGADITLRAYSTLYTLAFALAPLLGAWYARRRGLPWKRALAVYAGALVCGIVGARILDLFIASRLYAEDPSRIWAFSFTGFSLYGGLVLATFAGVALARVARTSAWQLADAAVPALVLGQVLMRTGCFLNGCCFGKMTELPWGVEFQPATAAWSYQLTTGASGLLGTLLGTVRPVHPTQLYEMGGAVVCGAIALWLIRRHPDGTRAGAGVGFLAYALGFTLVRLGNGFLRARVNTITAPEWFYPVLYLTLAAILAGLLVWRARAGKPTED
ncbi:MAG: prolipoprotein diacylglyceryl transferase [Actinobacteria bacterium]|nr:MAG: prolipoprotein diacylglyceryl transferase [Actinomycetota bacterium]